MKRTYYTNGVNEVRLYPSEDVPKGWYKGRVKSTVTTLGHRWINNGEKEILAERNSEIPNGWYVGRLKSSLNTQKSAETHRSKKYKHYTDGEKDYLIPCEDAVPEGLVKGRPKMSDEQRKKCSASHIGKHHTEDAKKKISENSNNNREKAYKTLCETYGSVENFYKYMHRKGEETKRINNSFNTSKPETLFYKELCEKYGKNNVLRNYKCDRYPFRCDFYIKSIDKFIELNLHWTHGSRPYVANDEFCVAQLELWKEKAKTSKFYEAAIQTWTERDVEKLSVATKNHLNYETIY